MNKKTRKNIIKLVKRNTNKLTIGWEEKCGKDMSIFIDKMITYGDIIYFEDLKSEKISNMKIVGKGDDGYFYLDLICNILPIYSQLEIKCGILCIHKDINIFYFDNVKNNKKIIIEWNKYHQINDSKTAAENFMKKFGTINDNLEIKDNKKMEIVHDNNENKNEIMEFNLEDEILRQILELSEREVKIDEEQRNIKEYYESIVNKKIDNKKEVYV